MASTLSHRGAALALEHGARRIMFHRSGRDGRSSAFCEGGRTSDPFFGRHWAVGSGHRGRTNLGFVVPELRILSVGQ